MDTSMSVFFKRSSVVLINLAIKTLVVHLCGLVREDTMKP